MASVPEDLVAYLDPLVSETAGDDLLEGPPPELPENLVALTHYGGEAAEGRVVGPSLTPPGVEVALVQLFVRNKSMSVAKAKADAYFALLDGFHGTQSGRKYHLIQSIDSTPFNLGQDQRELWRFAVNLRVQHAR